MIIYYPDQSDTLHLTHELFVAMRRSEQRDEAKHHQRIDIARQDQVSALLVNGGWHVTNTDRRFVYLEKNPNFVGPSTFETAALEDYKDPMIERLRVLAQPGVYLMFELNRRSADGSTHYAEIYIDDQNGERVNVTQAAAILLDWKYSSHAGIRIDSGTSTDAADYARYRISQKLYPDGFIVPESMSQRDMNAQRRSERGAFALRATWISR